MFHQTLLLHFMLIYIVYLNNTHSLSFQKKKKNFSIVLGLSKTKGIVIRNHKKEKTPHPNLHYCLKKKKLYKVIVLKILLPF